MKKKTEKPQKEKLVSLGMHWLESKSVTPQCYFSLICRNLDLQSLVSLISAELN